MKKLVFMVVAITALCFLAAACVSVPASAFFGPGNYYSDTVTVGEKRGEITSRIYFGIFGKETYPSVERVAKENGITKIATVEHYVKSSAFAIWSDYTTIVTGQ
ncbi:MAG: TRL-like family protein [Treponema sp.]|jgi:hypothetical protein|nr:TRL-like family protein [Treponema sp.]